jgi:ribosome-binding factor A
MTIRQEKVNSLLKQEVGNYLRAEDFEGISGILTITDAEVSVDMEHAKVYFSVVGQDSKEVQAILKNQIYEIQGILNRKLKMWKVPRIEFIPDSSPEYAQHIREIIKGLQEK